MCILSGIQIQNFVQIENEVTQWNENKSSMVVENEKKNENWGRV